MGTLTRAADAPRKCASPPQEGPTSRKRQASSTGSPERPTYVRTFTGDTDYNPQPQRVIHEIPRDIRVPDPLPLDPPDIVVLPAADRIIDYEQQTAAFRAQAAGGGPDPNAAHPVRSSIPRYIHDRASPINVPAVQFATPSATPIARVVGGRAVDDGSRPISAIALQTVLYVLNENASGIIGQEAAREFSNTPRDGPTTTMLIKSSRLKQSGASMIRSIRIKIIHTPRRHVKCGSKP